MGWSKTPCLCLSVKDIYLQSACDNNEHDVNLDLLQDVLVQDWMFVVRYFLICMLSVNSLSWLYMHFSKSEGLSLSVCVFIMQVWQYVVSD